MKVGDTVPIRLDGRLFCNVYIEKESLSGTPLEKIPTLIEPAFECHAGSEGEYLIVLYDRQKISNVEEFDVYMLFIADYIKEPRWFLGKCAIDNM